tara:strand:+ start:4483 stop:4737 length:255 start_codon:yes stop_codon:yes gene_type:complete
MIKKSILLNFLEEEVTPIIKKELEYIIKEGKVIFYPGIVDVTIKELDKLGLVENNKLPEDIKKWVVDKTRELLTPKNVSKNLRG